MRCIGDGGLEWGLGGPQGLLTGICHSSGVPRAGFRLHERFGLEGTRGLGVLGPHGPWMGTCQRWGFEGAVPALQGGRGPKADPGRRVWVKEV